MLDKSKPYAELFGCIPVRFTQDGIGFDGRGNELGPVDGKGNLVEDDERKRLWEAAKSMGIKVGPRTSTENLRAKVEGADSDAA